MRRLWLVIVLACCFWAGCSDGGRVAFESDSDAGQQGSDTSSQDGAGDVGSQDGVSGDSGKDNGDPGDGSQGDGAADGESPDADVPDDTAGDGDGQTGPEVLVATSSESETIPAGIALPITCIVKGLPDGSYATYLKIAGPADVEVDDFAIRFFKTGVYEVACAAKWAEGEATDETPLSIRVDAGPVASIQTSLSDNSIMAGESVTATCTIKDEFGNSVVTSPKLITNPSFGLDVYGMSIVGVVTGTYQVTCFDPTSQMSDLTPEQLIVSWGLPKRIITEISTDTIVAGQTAQVSCSVVDAYDNLVPDYQVSVFLSPGLTISGFLVSGTKAGLYQVICVPTEDPWDYFTLEPKSLRVTPAGASQVVLTATPPKPTYRMFETVTFKATAADPFGNQVEGASFLPLAYQPGDPGVILVAPWKYKFEVEGTFLFSACLQNNPMVCGTKTVTVDGYGPIITIKYPERGETINGKPAVTVIGNVIDPVSGVDKFSINGQNVPLQPNGDFTYVISSSQGMNMLVAVAEDPNGFKTLHVQAYYYSPVWYKTDINDPVGSQITDGILFFLGSKIFNDADHNPAHPDELSTIIEMTLATLDIGSFIPNPVASSGPYKVYVGPFSYSPPMVSLFPRDGGIEFMGNLNNLHVGVKAVGECKVLFIDFCPDVSGSVEIDMLQILQGFDIWVDSGKVKLAQATNKVMIYGLDVDIDGILGWLFDWLIDWFVDGYVGMLEETAMKMIAEQVEGIASGVLENLALNQQLSIPNPLDPNAPPASINLTSNIRVLDFSPDGVNVRLDPAVLAEKNVSHDVLGSIGRAFCLDFNPNIYIYDKNSIAEIGLLDDFLNQILFSAWNSGLLNMTVPVDQYLGPDALAGLGLGSLADMGISNITATIDPYLPPIITSCNEEQALQMQLGDMYIQLDMKMLNQPVSMGLFVSLAAEADLTIENGPTGPVVSLGLGEIDPLVAQVTHVSDNLQGAEGFMTMIVQGILLPTLLQNLANNSLASFEIPTLNISSFSSFLPAGIVWKFVVDEFVRKYGYTVLAAHIVDM